jgi:hypothetical protein
MGCGGGPQRLRKGIHHITSHPSHHITHITSPSPSHHITHITSPSPFTSQSHHHQINQYRGPVASVPRFAKRLTRCTLSVAGWAPRCARPSLSMLFLFCSDWAGFSWRNSLGNTRGLKKDKKEASEERTNRRGWTDRRQQRTNELLNKRIPLKKKSKNLCEDSDGK